MDLSRKSGRDWKVFLSYYLTHVRLFLCAKWIDLMINVFQVCIDVYRKYSSIKQWNNKRHSPTVSIVATCQKANSLSHLNGPEFLSSTPFGHTWKLKVSNRQILTGLYAWNSFSLQPNPGALRFQCERRCRSESEEEASHDRWNPKKQ